MTTININKYISEPYGDVVDEAFVRLNENAGGLDSFGEQEKDEIRDEAYTYEESDDDNNEEEQPGGAPSHTLLPIILDDDLNKKQRKIFNYILSKTIQSFKTNHAPKPESFHTFLTGSVGCGKSHLLTIIIFYLQKSLSYGLRDVNKEIILILAPTGAAAVNVDGSTSSLKERFSELMVIIRDEISMVSNKFLLYIHQRLCDIFEDTHDNLGYVIIPSLQS